jgi:hypothetical protein
MVFNNMDSFIFEDYSLLDYDAMLWRSFLPPCSGWYKKTALKTEAERFSETLQGIKIQKTVIIISNVVQTSVHNFVWW